MSYWSQFFSGKITYTGKWQAMDLSREHCEEKCTDCLSILKVILTDVKPQMFISHQKEILNECLKAVIVAGLNISAIEPILILFK